MKWYFVMKNSYNTESFSVLVNIELDNLWKRTVTEIHESIFITKFSFAFFLVLLDFILVIIF